MDLYEEDLYEKDDIREYSEDINPVDIGKWLSYMPYHNEDQKSLQRSNLISVPIANHYGEISFILSTYINDMEEYLEHISKEISIENSETILNTEVYYTSKLEGSHTTLKRTFEIHNGSKIDENDKFSESMIKGNFEAVKLLNVYGNRINEEILYKVWNALTTDCRNNTEIQGSLYRTGEVGVTNSDFVSVDAGEIKERMDELFSFYQSDLLNDRPFIKACIIHFAFETIHPFPDGNGRLGRLLMNNYLISQNIESCRAVSFSMYIDKNRGLYDNAFVQSENEYSDCTPFLEYMLDTMAQAYSACKELQNK